MARDDIYIKSVADGNIYRNAIKVLFDRTGGTFEHDDLEAIELFDKLLDEGIESHCDTVRQLCKDAGYSKYACDEIAHIYDVLYRYKLYKKTEIMYWDIEKLLNS